MVADTGADAGAWAVRVPGSSANLGGGFDVLGMALSVYAEVGCGSAPDDARSADEHHPAMIAFRRAGGSGDLWTRTGIPMARGLGFSGAMRVGGVAAAFVDRDGAGALRDPGVRRQVLSIAAELEQHADNAGASLEGGIVAVAAGELTRIPLGFDPAVVVWVPDSVTTSTDRSRTTLSPTVSRDDAVFNLGSVATFVAACAIGDPSRLRTGTADRLHQPTRLVDQPASAAAIEAALEAGAWAAWLSGSGPTVAMFCEPSRAVDLAAALPPGGHAKVLRIDHEGAVVIGR